MITIWVLLMTSIDVNNGRVISMPVFHDSTREACERGIPTFVQVFSNKTPNSKVTGVCVAVEGFK